MYIFAIFLLYSKFYHSYMIGIVWTPCVLPPSRRVSRRGRTGERYTISRAGTAKSLSTTIWLSLPPQNEQKGGGGPSVNTVGTIRC